jgi:hypothetical protein
MLAKPENREEAVAKLFRSVGGRLIGWYLTFGHHGWLVIGEFPDEKAAASAAWPLAARAQPSVPVIGFLHQGPPEPIALTNAFRQGLSEIGIIEGRSVTIENRWAEGQ